MSTGTNPPQKPPARWTKLTSEVRERYCEAVRLHLPAYLCAQYAGVSRDALHDWKQRARDGEEPFATFFREIAAARAEKARVLLGRISRASRDPKQWKAAVWLLEHIYSEDAEPVALLAQPGDGNRPDRHVIDATELDPEALVTEKIARIRESLARAQQDGSHVAVMHLNRELDKAIAELAALRKGRNDPTTKDEASFLADLEAAAESMPHAHLQVFVDVYLKRHRCKVVPDPDAGREEEA